MASACLGARKRADEGVADFARRRGKEAADRRRKYAHRIIPSRWHERWKDKGDTFDNKLNEPTIPKHLAAKSRWILLGSHDPDIANLNRTVPTPDTSDVPLALQMLASIKAKAWVGDMWSAFTQGLKGQRKEPLTYSKEHLVNMRLSTIQLLPNIIRNAV